MKIRIMKCENKNMWYANRIGDVIDVAEYVPGRYMTMDGKDNEIEEPYAKAMEDDMNCLNCMFGKNNLQIPCSGQTVKACIRDDYKYWKPLKRR